MWRICAASAGRCAAGGSAAPAGAPSRARPARSEVNSTSQAPSPAINTVLKSLPSGAIAFGGRSATPCDSSVRAKSTGSPPAPTSWIAVDHGATTAAYARRGFHVKLSAQTAAHARRQRRYRSPPLPCAGHGRTERRGVAQRHARTGSDLSAFPVPAQGTAATRAARAESCVKRPLIGGGSDPAAMRQGSRQTRGPRGLHGASVGEAEKPDRPVGGFQPTERRCHSSRCAAARGAGARGDGDQLVA